MRELFRDVNVGIHYNGATECQPYSFSDEGNLYPINEGRFWMADFGTRTIRGSARKKRELSALNRTAAELQTQYGPTAATLAPDGQSFTVDNSDHMETARDLMTKYAGKGPARI